MSDDNVLNRNLSPVTREQLRLGNPADAIDSDYRTITDQPQITFNGHIVPPPPPPDTQPPLIIGVIPTPQSFPFGIVNDGVYVDVTSDEALVDFDVLSNWVVSGAAAAGGLTVSSVLPLGSNGISFTYRVTLTGDLQEGLLEFVLNPSDAATPVRDASGNPVAKFTWDYWIDLTRPRITSIQPSTSQTLIFDENFFNEVKVFFSEFLGREGQDTSPALDLDRYTFLYKNQNGDVLFTTNPVSATLTKNDVYAYGADDGATTVSLVLPAITGSASALAQFTQLVLQVNDPDKLQDRAGNDLLPDLMEFSWVVQPADTVGPTWTPLDPSGACEFVPGPIEIDGTAITDGMVRMQFEFSEPVVGVTDPANWIVSGAPLTSDSSTESMQVVEVVEIIGGDKPVYEVRLQILGHSMASGVSVSMNNSAITDASGNTFTSAPLNLNFETTFPTVSTVNPVTVNPSWDYKVVVNFTHPVAVMSNSTILQSWKLVRSDAPNSTFFNPTEVLQQKNSSGGVTSHVMRFSEADVFKLSSEETNFTLALVHVTDLGTTFTNSTNYSNMVRGFPSSTSFNNDGGSCGGQGLPLSGSEKEFQQFYVEIRYRGDDTGPKLVSVEPTSGSQVTGTDLYNGVTFKFDEEVDWSKVQYNLTGTGMIENIDAVGNSVKFSVVGSDSPGTVYTVELSDIRDLAGNVGNNASATYTIRDTQGPRVAKTSPETVTLCPGDYDGTTVQLSFDENLDPATVTTDNFTLSVNNLNSPDANEAINIKSATLVGGNIVELLLAPESNVHTTVGYLIRVTASQSVTDVDGNPVDSSNNYGLFTHNCTDIRPPENLEVVVDYSGSSPTATLYWSAPSNGLPASGYKAELISPFESTWLGSSTFSYSSGVSAGTYIAVVKSRFVNGSTSVESDWATISYTVQETYTRPDIDSAGFVTQDGTVINTGLGTLLVGPRYFGDEEPGQVGKWGVKGKARDAARVHVYLISTALKGDALPPGLTDAYIDLDSSVPRIDTFPPLVKSEWIDLGYATVDAGDNFNFMIKDKTPLKNAATAAGYDLGETSGGYWFDIPLVFNDLFLVALVAEHSEGATAGAAQYSTPLVLGKNSSGRPCLYMSDPIADNQAWGLKTWEDHPTPSLQQQGSSLVLKWDAPTRGVSNPSSYQVGLFKTDNDTDWVHVTTSSVSGNTFEKVWSNGLTNTTTYMARVVTLNESSASWTKVDWDDDGDNFLDLDKPAFDAGWGGRSNVIRYVVDTGGGNEKQAEFARSIPEAGATVRVNNLAGSKIQLIYTADVQQAGGTTYRVVITDIDNGGNTQVINEGTDYTVESANASHQITLNRNFGGKQVGVTVIGSKVRSADGSVVNFADIDILYVFG